MPKITKESKKNIKKAFLKSLEAGVSITDACEAAHVSRTTIWNWRQESKRFDDKVNAVIDSRNQSMEDALYSSGIKGNVAAQIFWLKNRYRKRWKDRFEQKVEIEGEIGLDIKEYKIIKAMSEEEREKFIKQLSKVCGSESNRSVGEDQKED
jgi:hypothetical protein